MAHFYTRKTVNFSKQVFHLFYEFKKKVFTNHLNIFWWWKYQSQGNEKCVIISLFPFFIICMFSLQSWVFIEHAQETASYEMICRFTIMARPCYIVWNIIIIAICSHYIFGKIALWDKDDTAAGRKHPCMDHEA